MSKRVVYETETSRCAGGNQGHWTSRRRAVHALERRGRPVHHPTVEDSGLLQITYTDGARDVLWTYDPDVVRRHFARRHGANEILEPSSLIIRSSQRSSATRISMARLDHITPCRPSSTRRPTP